MVRGPGVCSSPHSEQSVVGGGEAWVAPGGRPELFLFPGVILSVVSAAWWAGIAGVVCGSYESPYW